MSGRADRELTLCVLPHETSGSYRKRSLATPTSSQAETYGRSWSAARYELWSGPEDVNYKPEVCVRLGNWRIDSFSGENRGFDREP